MRLTFDRKMPLSEQRLRVALSQSTRKAGKNHGTGKRNSAIRAARKARTAQKVAVSNKERRRRLEIAREYWRGERDCLA